MAEYQISGVRTEPSGHDMHEHISHIRVEGGVIFVRQTVVDDLRSYDGIRYYMLGGGGRTEVTVVSCPECGFGDYLRTTADSTTADSLFRLPRV